MDYAVAGGMRRQLQRSFGTVKSAHGDDEGLESIRKTSNSNIYREEDDGGKRYKGKWTAVRDSE